MFFTAYMKFLLLFVFCCLSAFSSHATQFEGHVIKLKNKLYFSDGKDPRKYVLSGSTPLLTIYINKLDDGDFVSIEAAKTSGNDTLVVQSINYVGLQEIIGTWITSDMQDCYIFTSYTEFHIASRINGRCVSDGDEVYNYFVNPSTKQWIVLIAGQNDSYVGDIELSYLNRIEIKLYNSEDGTILRQLSLRKIAQ